MKMSSPERSRWLVIDKSQQGSEKLIALIHTVKDAEIRAYGKDKILVRFVQCKPEGKKEHINSIQVLHKKILSLKQGEESTARQYCAVLRK